MQKKFFRTEFSENIFNYKYKHKGAETWDELSKTLVEDVCRDKMPEEEKEELSQMHSAMQFIAGGRYLYYAGRANKYFNNCYLLKSEEDSREDWANLSWKAESCLMTGGGIGNDYSIYRSKGSKIEKTGGTASGPISKMKMVNEIGREVMQGGSRRCLPEDALVFTQRGLVRIKDIQVGDVVHSQNGLNKVLNVFEQGHQNVDKINTSSGAFYATHNHRMAVLDDNGEVIWKTVDELVQNDILLHFNRQVEGKITSLPEDFTQQRPESSTTCRDLIIPELDTEIAWLIGLVHGDGYVYNRYNPRYKQASGKGGSSTVKIACHLNQVDIQKRCEDALARFGCNVKITQKKDENCVVVSGNGQRMVEYFEKYIKQPKEIIVVPDFILQGTVEIRSAYLAGVMDSDGAMENRPPKLVTTVYQNFAEQLQNLYSSLGICTRMSTTIPKEEKWMKKWEVCLIGFRDIYNQTVSKFSCKGEMKSKKLHRGFKVPISIVKKQFEPKDLRKVLPSFNVPGLNYETFVRYDGILDFIPVLVTSIDKSVKNVPTFDIEVENDHNFYCDGLLTHNSAIYASLNWRHDDASEFLHCKDWASMPIAGAYDEEGNNITVAHLKEKDFNYPAPLDMTNISLNYDNDFLSEIYNKPFEELQEIYRTGGKQVVFELPIIRIPLTFVENCRQALKTGEPGFSFNFFDKVMETLRNACTEVTSEDDSDVCNLGSVNMANIETKEEFARVCYLGGKFLLLGTLVAQLPYQKIYETREKNRRLGLGLMGVHEWLLKRGYQYEVTPELHEWLEVYRVESERGANELAEELGISKPVAYRAIAPTGTIGIMAGTTTGIEPLFAVAYKRRYLKGQKDWHYQYVIDGTAKILIQQYDVDPYKIETALSLSNDPERRIKFQADIQDYVDMSISSTINLPKWGTEGNNDTLVNDFAKILGKYAVRLRGFTCYPDGSRGGQPLSIVDYYEAREKEGEEFKEHFHDICEIGGKGGTCGV